MSDILLVRQEAAEISESDKDVVRRVLFGIVDGLGDMHRKRWRRFINWLLRMEPGEMAEIKTRRPRSGPFHRRHMALEQAVFEEQEKFEHFEQFRNWLKVGAGHCEWLPGPRGGVIPVPKSIAYDQIDEDEMREFHDSTVRFLREEHAGAVLWKHLKPAGRMEKVEAILGGFGE